MAPKQTKKSAKTQNKKGIVEEDNKNITDTFKQVKKPTSVVTSSKTIKTKNTEIDIPSMQTILEAFDLNCDYGPIIGMTRTDRLKRAEYFNLPVSDDVKNILKDKDLLEKHPELNLNLWHDYETYI